MKLGQLKASIIKAGFFLILGILALSVAMGQVQLSESAEQHSDSIQSSILEQLPFRYLPWLPVFRER